MKKILTSVVFMCMMLLTVSAYSQQVVDEKPITEKSIIMMNSLTCGFCQAFLTEAMPQWGNFQKYEMDNAGIVVPKLYILDMPPEREYPKWWIEKYNDGAIPQIRGTPTFFLWDGEKVVDKVVGYDRKAIFKMLHEILYKHKTNK